MLFSKSSLFAIAAVAGLVSAQDSTPTGSVKTHVVNVGDQSGSLTFSPDDIKAALGDLVQFHFYPSRHSVAQSNFANPCEPLPKTNGTEGFWSGFMPVTATDTKMPVFTIVVKDANPIWYYCATAKHCQAGMAGVINAPASGVRTLDQYKAASKNVATTVVPTTASGTGASNDTSSGAPSGSGTPPSNNTEGSSPTPDNSASGLMFSSAFAIVAAGVAAALTF